MIVRAKTKRRLIILAAAVVLAAGALAGAFFVHRQMQRTNALRARDEGMAALEKHDYFTAMHRIGTYCNIFKEDADARYHYAEARLQVAERDGGHISQATNSLRYALDLQPGHRKAAKLLLDLYVQRRQPSEAVALADRMLVADPKDAHALRSRAVAHAMLRNQDKALADATAAAALDPADIGGQILLMDVKRLKGEAADKIVEQAKALVDAHPNDGRFELVMAVACLGANNAQQAAEWLRKAASRDVHDPAFVERLAGAAVRVGLFQESFNAIDSAAKANPDVNLQRLLAARLAERNAWQPLLDRIVADPSLPGSDAALLALRAMAFFELGRHGDAQPILTALASRQGNPVASDWVAVLRAVYGGEKPKAIAEVCQLAVGRFSDNAFFRRFAAEAYEKLGENDTALQHWTRAAQSAPAWSLPPIQLARSYTARRRIEDAIRWGQYACACDPKNPEALSSLAMAYLPAIGGMRAEEVGKVLQLVEEVQKLSPNEPRTLPLQVLLLARTGQKEAAIARLKQVLASPRMPDEKVLIELAAVSRFQQLDMESACYAASEQTHGLTPDLAFARAAALAEAKQPQQGLDLIKTAMAAPHKGDPAAWELARARFLEVTKDPAAREACIKLGDAYTDNADIQWFCLAAASVQSDHDFVGRTLDRAKALVGDQGVNWRLAKAQWQLRGKRNDRDLADAIKLLIGVKADSDLPVVNLLLAEAYAALGSTSESIAELRTALVKEPGNIATAMQLSRLHQQRGEYNDAAAYLNRILQNAAASSQQRQAAAELLARQGNADEALRAMEQLAAQGDQSTSDLLLAQLYRQRNDIQKCDEMCRKLLQNPDEGDIRFVADFYRSQGRAQEAGQVLALLDKLTLKPGIKDLILGDYQERAGAFDKAIEYYTAATRAAPDNAAAWKAVIAANLTAGRIPAALAAVDQASRLLASDEALAAFKTQASVLQSVFADLDKVQPWLRPAIAGSRLIAISLLRVADDNAAAIESLRILAAARASGERPDAVIAKLRPLADRNARFLPLQLMLTDLCLAVGRFDDAAAIASRTTQAFPGAVEPARAQAQALAAAGRWSEAVPAAQQWRQRTLAQPLQADLLLANAHLNLNEPAIALKSLEPHVKSAIQQPESMAAVLTLQARALVQSRRSAQAADLLRPLLAKAPAWRAVWMDLAWRFTADEKTAVAWMNEISPLVPADAADEQINLAFGWHMLKQRSADPAVQAAAADSLARAAKGAASIAAAANPATPELLFRLGMMQESGNDLPAAEASYRQAIRLDERHGNALNNLAMVLVNRGGDLNEALKLAAGAVQSNPREGNYHDTLATVQLALKQYDAAIASMNAAMRLEPANVDMRINLASVYDQAGKTAEARNELRQIERDQPQDRQLSARGRKQLQQLRQKYSAAANTQPG